MYKPSPCTDVLTICSSVPLLLLWCLLPTVQHIHTHAHARVCRCTLHSAAQLAQTIKPVFEYDERRVAGPSSASLFEARCIVRSNLEELAGLILVKEAKGSSIKAAREGAAVKVKVYLLSKEISKVQPLGCDP